MTETAGLDPAETLELGSSAAMSMKHSKLSRSSIS